MQEFNRAVTGGAHAQSDLGGPGGRVRDAAAAFSGGRRGRLAGRMDARPRTRSAPGDSGRRGGAVGRRQLPRARAALPAGEAQYLVHDLTLRRNQPILFVIKRCKGKHNWVSL